MTDGSGKVLAVDSSNSALFAKPFVDSGIEILPIDEL